MKRVLTASLLAVVAILSWQSAPASEFQTYAMLLRKNAILNLVMPISLPSGFNRYPWKRNIVATVFWVGERPTANNPVPNIKSSWDARWAASFGGYDDPDPAARKNFVPKEFVPRQNPFYVALPFNDVRHGGTKPESRKAIPWFKQAFEKSGQSVCKGRWVAIRHNGRIAFAQWEDCGPFRTDHWAYVFGNERPRLNLNQSAGLDISPSVRDYLGMGSKGIADWKFVEASEVPPGPWTKYGENNTFVLQHRGANLFDADPNNANGTRK
jgi:hypothetical protein